MDETQLGIRDLNGKEIYFDIPLSREDLDELIAPEIDKSIIAARETLERAGITPHNVNRVVFVGGPTHYQPLRDKVAFELGIAPSTEAKPMTAVAEGAAVFAKSIDWASESRGRKKSRASVIAGGALNLSLSYNARTPDLKTRVVVKIDGAVAAGAMIQIDSLDTGSTTGRSPLKDSAILDLLLSKPGENTFKIFVFDSHGGPIALANDRFVITRTAASIDGIPASHSIGVEAKTRAGGASVLVYLVRAGDQLPKKGQLSFKAETALKAQSQDSLRFKLWEGDIEDPVTDNEFIGVFEVRGHDIDEGVVVAGDALELDYEVLELRQHSPRGLDPEGRQLLPQQPKLLLPPGRASRSVRRCTPRRGRGRQDHSPRERNLQSGF